MDLGTDLRQARERAGVSLHDLAARTRIPLHHLQAIERNELSKVPPGIFLRSFIRTYAREVGVDPVAAIDQYRAMTAPIEEVQPESKAPPVKEESRSESILRELFEARSRWGSAVIVAALLAGVIAVNRYGVDTSSNTRKATAVVSAETPAPMAQPTPIAPTPIAPTPIEPIPIATTGTGLQMEIRAENDCWVRAVVDGQPTFARLLQPGEKQSLTAQRDIVLRVGDPAALSYSVNGREGPPLGSAAVPVTIRFASDGSTSRPS